MRLFPDRPDILTAGQWYWADPSAAFVPFWHVFGSRSWDLSGELPYDPPIGEVTRGAWTNGVAPAWLKTGKYCGTHWETGVPYAERPGLAIGLDGYPLCCPKTQTPALLGLQGSVEVLQALVASASIGLRVEAKVTRPITSECATFKLPNVLYAHFGDGTGCPDLDGKTFALTYSPTGYLDAAWYSEPFPIGGVGEFYCGFNCVFGWRITVRHNTDNFEVIGGSDGVSTTPPLNVLFTGIRSTIGSCVLTDATIEVSET